MKWSIFDPKNEPTIDEVRQEYNVSIERLDELKAALAHAKSKLQRATSVRVQRTNEFAAVEMETTGLAHFSSRKDVLQVFNRTSLKTKIKGLMDVGVVVAYVGDSSAKLDSKRVYKLDMDRLGRIKVTVAIPDNPQRLANSGLYSVTLVDPERKAAIKLYKSKTRSISAAGGFNARKRRKPRVHIEAEIGA